jgi:hypothetical protein
MTVLITINSGFDAGPFDLYSDADSFSSPFETNVSREDLDAGYPSALVPDVATIIRAISTGDCVNQIDLEIGTTTTTTTLP